MSTEILTLIISSLAAAGILALLAYGRKILTLPKEMLIVKAALFRVLRSNKTQGIALATIAQCQRDKKCNGDTEMAIARVRRDQEKIDEFLKAALFDESKIEIVEKED